MKEKSEFVLMTHKAKKSGEHVDLRYRLPKSVDVWNNQEVDSKKIFASYATRKAIPLKPEDGKILMFATTLHNRYQYGLTGKIKEGNYGAGYLEKWDSGECVILKHTDRHIVINFNGSTLNGLYHFIKIKFDDKTKQGSYLFFKSKREWEEK